MNTSFSERDHFWMNFALGLARTAKHFEEVPIGAVLISADGRILGTGFNTKHRSHNVTHHAEILAINQACSYLSNWRLLNTRLYVTLEPCLMCSGALCQARIGSVVFATHDPKAGAMGSLYSVHNDMRLNHKIEVYTGLMEEQSQNLLKDFFKGKRKV